MGDRAFAFVRTPGPKGFPWHTGREQEDLVLFRPHFREGGAATLPPDIEETFKMAWVRTLPEPFSGSIDRACFDNALEANRSPTPERLLRMVLRSAIPGRCSDETRAVICPETSRRHVGW
jgi:hypothetical protein